MAGRAGGSGDQYVQGDLSRAQHKATSPKKDGGWREPEGLNKCSVARHSSKQKYDATVTRKQSPMAWAVHRPARRGAQQYCGALVLVVL